MSVSSAAGERPCAGAKQGALLALLALNVNQRVSIDDLVVGAWGYDAQVSNSTVENHVWRLRRLLDPAYSRASSTVLLNDSGGYRLALPEGALDSMAFEALADRGRAALDGGRPDESLAACDVALDLWRGTPYDVIAHVPATAAGAARLEEIRGQVIETRIDALIRAGSCERALADLELLLERFPYRERLWGLRMTALTSSGRAEEALQTFGHVRQLLRDELGIEPGPELQQLQQSLLLARAEPPNGSTPGSPSDTRHVGHVHLPNRSLPLLGRAFEVGRLRDDLQHGELVTITGAGGCGKTRLAIEVARQLGERFPDGIWFVDLTAVTEPERVPDAVASAIGLSSEGADTLDALGSYVRERQTLLVLDNCEHVLDGAADVAEAFVAQDTDSALFVTSRQPLLVEGETTRALEPLPVRGPDELGEGVSPAAELFWSRLGRAPLESEGSDERALVEAICRAVDGLPLAIELAAARAQAFTLDEILAQVAEDPSRLGRIGRGADERSASLWAAIDWSHRLLESRDQAIHRRLSVLPGPFTLPAATAVAQGTDLDVEDVPEGLVRLVHRSLLVSSPPVLPGRPTVFRQLDTVRAHARHLVEQTAEIASTTARRDSWVHQLVESRPRLGAPASKAYYDNLDDAYPAIRAAWERAVTPDPDPQVLLDGASMPFYWYYRQRLVEGRNWMQAVADAALPSRAPDDEPIERVQFRVALAAVHMLSGDVDVALRQLDEALPKAPGCSDEAAIAMGEVLVVAGNAAWARNEYAAAQQISVALTSLARRLDDPELLLFADHVANVARIAERPPAETAAVAESVYERALAAKNHTAAWCACGARMIVAALTDDPDAGIVWIDRLIPSHARFGNGGGGAFLEALGNFGSLSDDPELAIRMYGVAYAELRRVGMVWPVQINTLELVERARAAVSPEVFSSLWDKGQLLTYEQVARTRGVWPAR